MSKHLAALNNSCFDGLESQGFDTRCLLRQWSLCTLPASDCHYIGMPYNIFTFKISTGVEAFILKMEAAGTFKACLPNYLQASSQETVIFLYRHHNLHSHVLCGPCTFANWIGWWFSMTANNTKVAGWARTKHSLQPVKSHRSSDPPRVRTQSMAYSRISPSTRDSHS